MDRPITTSRNGHQSLKYIYLSEVAFEKVGSELELPFEKQKHLCQVLRLMDGDRLKITNGRGEVFNAELKIAGRQGMVKILGRLERSAKESAPRLVMHLGFAKNPTMDAVVEKLTEIGVHSLAPVFTSRSVVKHKASDSTKYIERWRSIMGGALEQSEGAWLPTIQIPQPWKDWKTTAGLLKGPKFYFSSFGRDEGDLSQSLNDLRKNASGSQEPIHLAVGPEGGFSAEEEEDLKRLGFRSLSLGARILRVETAAVVAATLAALV